jgi:hypothetical protein
MQFSSTKSISTDVVLLKITCLAWFIAKIMSFKLWTADRIFPVIPTFDFISVSNDVHLFLYIVSLFGFGIIFVVPNKKIILAVLIFEILACLLYYMRWQPWEYQYLLTLSFFLFAKDRKQFLLLFSFLIGCTYIFSGAHKFGGSFLYTFCDRIILHKILGLQISTIKNPIVHYSGLLLCIIEILIGLGFLFFKNKKYVCVMAIAMHLLIILIYGPTGMNYNLIIVPWNVAMIFFSIVFFNQKEALTFRFEFFKSKLNSTAVLFVGILPLFSFFDKWDHYLSFNLYSGNTKALVICVADPQQYSVLEKYKSATKNNKYCEGAYLVDANKWAMNELSVPVIPEDRVYLKMRSEFNKRYPNIRNRFVYYRYPYKKENIKVLP